MITQVKKTIMRKLMYFAAVLLSMGFMACNNGKTNAPKQSEDTVAMTDTTDTTAGDFKEIITSNEGKTALDAKLFDNETFTARLKTLAGAEYDSIVANFNTQTPIMSEEGIYKFTGGKAHAVPEFNTTILYDSNNDNLNVIIEKNDKRTLLKEKDEIKITKTLESK